MMKRPLSLILLLLLLSVILRNRPASAAAPTPQNGVVNSNLTLVAQSAGSISALAVVDELLLVAAGSRLYILEAAADGQLSEVGRSPLLDGKVNAIHATGTTIYLAAGYAGVYELDITQPNQPVVSDHDDTPGFANQLAVTEATLYVADWAGGLLRYDLVSGLNRPARYQPGIVSSVAPMDNGELVISLGFGGSQRLDFTGSAPTILASLSVPSWDLLATNEYVLSSNGFAGGISILAAAGAGQLQPLAELPLVTPKAAWLLADEILWLASESGELFEIELDAVAGPEINTFAVNQSRLDALAVWQDQLLVGGEQSGLQRFDLAEGGLPLPAAGWSQPAVIRDVVVQGSYLFAAAADQGVLVFENATLNHVARLHLPGSAQALLIRGSFLYVAAGDAGLLTVDISAPVNPELVDQQYVAGEALALALTRNYLLLAAGSGGLQLFRLDMAGQPDWQSSYHDGREVRDVAAYKGYAFIANLEGVQILAVLDPGTLHPNYEVITNGYATAVAAANDKLYIADWYGLHISDISRLQLITATDYIALPGQVQAVATAGDSVYVGLGEAGVVVLGGAEHKVSAAFDTTGIVRNLLPDGADLHVADQSGGLLRLAQENYLFRNYLPVFHGQ